MSRIFLNGFYHVESSNEATVFGNANDIRVIRTVYAYYSLND
nr:hypothetical protein [Tissierella praeacuta]